MLECKQLQQYKKHLKFKDMTNTLIFTKKTSPNSITVLDNLAADLNASATDIKYYFFVLSAIVKRHYDLKTRTDAKRYLAKQEMIQDDFDYLSNCIEFLRRQLQETPSNRTLNQAELIERKRSLANDIFIFIQMNNTIKKACIRFTNDYFQIESGQIFKAA